MTVLILQTKYNDTSDCANKYTNVKYHTDLVIIIIIIIVIIMKMIIMIIIIQADINNKNSYKQYQK